MLTSLINSVVSSINKKACLLACLLENSTKFTQPLILETYSKPLYWSPCRTFLCADLKVEVYEKEFNKGNRSRNEEVKKGTFEAYGGAKLWTELLRDMVLH